MKIISIFLLLVIAAQPFTFILYFKDGTTMDVKDFKVFGNVVQIETARGGTIEFGKELIDLEKSQSAKEAFIKEKALAEQEKIIREAQKEREREAATRETGEKEARDEKERKAKEQKAIEFVKKYKVGNLTIENKINAILDIYRIRGDFVVEGGWGATCCWTSSDEKFEFLKVIYGFHKRDIHYSIEFLAVPSKGKVYPQNQLAHDILTK